jgi:hypothetical protein
MERYPIQYKEKNTHVIVASVFHKKPPHFQVDIYQNLPSFQILKHKVSHEIVTQIERKGLSTTNIPVCIPFEMSRTPNLTRRL